MAENTLHFGDNLKILRDNIRDETVDLIYLDPPFNSKSNYNVLFKSPKGHESHAQITAFEQRLKFRINEARFVYYPFQNSRD